MKALILAGGKGTRLRMEIGDIPKVMAPVAGKPFLSYIIAQLGEQGITDICLGVGYLYKNIMEYFQDGSRFGVNLSYSIEKQPLGTGGAIKNAATQLSDPFLILNGDSYFDINFGELIRFHRIKSGVITMAVTKEKDASRYGSVQLDQENRVTAFMEKTTSMTTTLINSGIYIINKSILRDIPGHVPVSLENDVLPRFVNKDFFGLIAERFFIDIGTPSSYKKVYKGLPMRY